MPLELLYGVGAIILLAVLAWAVVVPQLKSPKARAVREEAVRREYTAPQQYARHEQHKMAAKAEQAEKDARKT